MDSEQENDTLTESNLEEIEEHISKFNGDEVVKKYLKGKFLGKGGFAKCYELKCVSNKKTYAGKIISKSNIIKPSAKNKLKSEIKIHKSLSHPNIVKFEHYFEDNENVYILLELCKSKTLNELLKKRKILSELEVKYYLFQILNAVKYMHKSKVIHRDLKLGNLFLSASLEIKIGDFGLATRVEYDGERKHTVCGTPNYIAPEILENKSTGHSYEVDYWAIGVIVYTLLIGRPPFETDDVKETYKKINANIYSFPPHVYISEVAKDFIQKILVTNPSNRLTPDMMLSHPFMNSTPIPKEMPHYTLSNPPKVDFFRGYEEDNEKITSPNQLSFENDKEHLEILRNFALKNLKKCDDMNKGFIDLKSSHKYNKEIDISDTKENHELLKKKVEDFDVNKLVYCDMIYDYSEKFGILFKMSNNNIIGCVFNDKSVLFKYYGKNNVCYENRKKKIHKVFDSKNIITSIKQKYEILINFEKYLTTTKDKTLSKEKSSNNFSINCIYVQKIIKNDISILLKLSNKVIQLTFRDNSIIIIDKDITQRVFFFDKNNKKSNYSIHSVNKCTNKRFMNRYEHYKKIYFEKMDERFQKMQQMKELDTSSSRSNFDLNKTL